MISKLTRFYRTSSKPITLLTSPIGCLRRNSCKIRHMKRVMVMLVAVILCSLSAWCNSSMIVALGTEVIENNTLSSAKESFRNSAMPPQIMPSGKYGYISESPLLMAVIDSDTYNSIKEVDFLCGFAMWYGIEGSLEKAGYTCVNLIMLLLITEMSYRRKPIQRTELSVLSKC